MTIAGGILILPLVKKEFVKHEIANLVVRRSFLVIGTFLMMMNAAIVAEIADTASIGVTDELFRYMWLLGWLGWFFMGFMVLKTLLDVLEMYKWNKTQKRMGGNNE